MSNRQGFKLVPRIKSKSPGMSIDQVICRVVSEEPLGAYSIFEVIVPPLVGLRPHINHWGEEIYYLLGGELLIQTGKLTFAVTAGSFVDIPKGSHHAIKNEKTQPAKLVVIVTPIWYRRFFEEWISKPLSCCA